MTNENKATNTPPLGGTWQDNVGSLVKGGIGSIPIVGAIFSEIFGMIIPNQRINRIEAYLRLLAEKLESDVSDNLADKLTNPEAVDLFEHGVWQSVRAVTEERKNYVAQLVANGLNGDEKSKIESKRLLALLAELDDDQIIILTSYTNQFSHNAEWRHKQGAVLTPVRAFLGSSQETLDENTVYELARTQLYTLGLLQHKFRAPKKGEIPEFDPKTGTIKASSRDITPLGRLLLTRLGVIETGKF